MHVVPFVHIGKMNVSFFCFAVAFVLLRLRDCMLLGVTKHTESIQSKKTRSTKKENEYGVSVLIHYRQGCVCFSDFESIQSRPGRPIVGQAKKGMGRAGSVSYDVTMGRPWGSWSYT